MMAGKGDIIVKVYRRSKRSGTSQPQDREKMGIVSSSEVHGKALTSTLGDPNSHGFKLSLPLLCLTTLSHLLVSSLGTPRKVGTFEVWNTTKLDGNDYPVAIYCFKYRSKG